MHIKRETHELFLIFGTLILSQITVIFISMFFSFPHFLLSFVFFYAKKVELFFGIFIGLFFLFFKAISSFHKDEAILGNERGCEQEIIFCAFQRNFHQSSLFRFLFEWVCFDLRYEFAAYISSFFHLHFQVFFNITFHFEHKYSL